LTKELAMPTALVTPHAFSCWVAMANFENLGLDETRSAREIRG
jgi:hypothetical protein